MVSLPDRCRCEVRRQIHDLIDHGFSTVLWYKRATDNSMRPGTLSLIYWGASLMWLGDAIFEYAELQAEYFTPAAGDMLNDFYLGLSVVALGLPAWLVALLLQEPRRVLKTTLLKKT